MDPAPAQQGLYVRFKKAVKALKRDVLAVYYAMEVGSRRDRFKARREAQHSVHCPCKIGGAIACMRGPWSSMHDVSQLPFPGPLASFTCHASSCACLGSRRHNTANVFSMCMLDDGKLHMLDDGKLHMRHIHAGARSTSFACAYKHEQKPAELIRLQ